MNQTPYFELPLLVPHQAQKELTVNEALLRIDALLHSAVLKADMETPLKYLPENGTMFLLGANPTGIWEGKAHHLALYYQGWRFIPPRLGKSYFVLEEKNWRYWDGGWWHKIMNKEENHEI